MVRHLGVSDVGQDKSLYAFPLSSGSLLQQGAHAVYGSIS